MKTIALFNTKGGVGTTSLVYHLAYLMAERGLSVVAVDFDPQTQLSLMFLGEDRLEEFECEHRHTVYDAVQPLLTGTGDIRPPHVVEIAPQLGLVVGDLALARAEDEFGKQWFHGGDDPARAWRVLTSFWHIIEMAAHERTADVVFMDVGPNLGPLNRAALLAAQHIVIPLAPAASSLQALDLVGPTLRAWRHDWQRRVAAAPPFAWSLPSAEMQPVGYIVLQHSVRLGRSFQSYERWVARMPRAYREAMLEEAGGQGLPGPDEDPYRLARLRYYHSLMPLALAAHKPMFQLRPADGAIGSGVSAVLDCYREFLGLARKLTDAIGIALP